MLFLRKRIKIVPISEIKNIRTAKSAAAGPFAGEKNQIYRIDEKHTESTDKARENTAFCMI